MRGLPVLLLALCGGRTPPEPAVWWEPALPSTMHPLYAASTLDLRAQAPVYDRLVRPTNRGWESAVVEAAELEGGQVSLRLRRDVRWHDGQRLRPAQVCESIEALRSTRHASPLGARLRWRLQHCTVHPSQAWTVVVHLSDTGERRPWEALSIPLLPTHLDGDLADPGHPISERPIGTGAWRAQRNPEGWRYEAHSSAHHAPAIQTLQLTVRPPAVDSDIGVDASVDGWPLVPADAVAALRDREGWALYAYPRQVVIQIALDSSGGPTSDPTLRAALDKAIDRAGLCSALGQPDVTLPSPYCTPVSGPFPVRSRGYNHGVPVPEPVSPSGPPAPLSLGLIAELEVDPDTVAKAIEAAWHPHPVSWEVVPTKEVWEMDVDARRDRWDALVVQRIPASEDLRPMLGVSGGLNWFGTADPSLTPFLDGEDSPTALRALHAAVADRRHHLFLFEVGGMSAWRSRYDPAWMTPTDGLGSLSRWGLSEAEADRHRSQRARPGPP